jgi:hypothetical protein
MVINVPSIDLNLLSCVEPGIARGCSRSPGDLGADASGWVDEILSLTRCARTHSRPVDVLAAVHMNLFILESASSV